MLRLAACALAVLVLLPVALALAIVFFLLGMLFLPLLWRAL